MRRADFTYELPDELIAQHPPPERRQARLLCLDGGSGALSDRRFPDFEALISPDDLLVMNDTRVFPARALGRKASGGRVEMLVERVLDPVTVLAHLRASKPARAGGELVLSGGARAEVLGRDGDLFKLRFDRPVLAWLDEYGDVPLPPYIRREATPDDRARYQTVYADRAGAVAAPTAGLHFDEAMLALLDARGVRRATLTLHVGAGTFQPVRSERIEDHIMHSEVVDVGADTCAAIEATRIRGGRVIAIGTTTVRALETAAATGSLAPFRGPTTLFLYPGARFRVVDALLTNFHLPESTLLMLVSAFAGHAHVMRAYAHAVERRYRFFSYGDAMFVTPDPAVRRDDDAV